MPSLPDKPIIAQPAPRCRFEQLKALDVVLVLRKCGQCHQQKPLEHFLLHHGRRSSVTGDVKVCATCRRRAHDIWGTPRHLGRYLDLPLDDWAELTA